jgi:hypothetical protein
MPDSIPEGAALRRPPPIPVPDLLPSPAAAGLDAAAPELALALYRRVAETARAAEAERRQASEELAGHLREAGRALARLAAPRFELGRLLARIQPLLAGGGLENVAALLDLFARAWDAELERAGVEVREVTGLEVSDELAAHISVAAAVPDPRIARAVVSETLSPLVVWSGRVVGVAQVITAVPAAAAAPDPPRTEAT